VSGLDPAEVQRLHAAAVGADTADGRGKAYEKLAAYVFDSIDGTIIERDVSSPLGAEQIDVVVGNPGVIALLPELFFVECKFWDKPVDSKSVGYFINVCRNRRCLMAVIVSPHGITGDRDEATRAHSLALSAAADGIVVVVITTKDLLELSTAEEASLLLTRLYMKAAASGAVAGGAGQ
jgi:Holliday junction resolvase-like predicted endonuclease